MNINWGTFSKVLAWVLLICGVFGGIIAATQVKGDLGILLVFAGIIGGVISFCHFGTLSYLADKASKIPEEAGQVNQMASDPSVNGKADSTSDATDMSEGSVPVNNETIIDAVSFATLFHNYNVKVILDNNLLGVVSPGRGELFHIDPLDGKHVLRLEKEDDSNVYALKEIESSGARKIRIGFSGKADRIAIDYLQIF